MTELIQERRQSWVTPKGSRAAPVMFIARLEWLQARRQRLFAISSLMLLLLGLSVCLSFSADSSLLAEPMAALKSLSALWGLALPLMALMAGFKGIAAEREAATLGLLLTAPLTDTQLLLGKWLGGVLPLLLAISLAALMTAMIYGFASDGVPAQFYPGLLRLWLGGTALTLACHLTALAISAWCTSSQSALFLGLAWLGALLFLWDLALLLALLLGAIPAGLLEGLMYFNPLSLFRDFCEFGALPLWALFLQLAAVATVFRLGLIGLGRREL
ncbi:ABC transporter permease [Shewanella sp. 3B26]|uniref:ABC transporter permease n=1 Tax=Shewanella zhuhaiensis TaxID=2919576 RepID=A0AAJ1EY95_9GAMM|nr:ABC transporter permease subunit [Shewanella zhuhaiensis]MCH4292761.1 ABC transporter permease [Shewanella zhuhaiensis]